MADAATTPPAPEPGEPGAPADASQPLPTMHAWPARHAGVWSWLFQMQPELRAGTRCGVMSLLELVLGRKDATTREQRDDKVVIHFTNRRICILWLDRCEFEGPQGTSTYPTDTEAGFKAAIRELLIN